MCDVMTDPSVDAFLPTMMLVHDNGVCSSARNSLSCENAGMAQPKMPVRMIDCKVMFIILIDIKNFFLLISAVLQSRSVEPFRTDAL